MAAMATSDGTSTPLRTTEYSAIPVSNSHAPVNTLRADSERQGFLHRLVPARTVLAIAVALTLCAGLVGRESAKWDYNRAVQDFSHLVGTGIFNEPQVRDVPYEHTITHKMGFEEVLRKEGEDIYLSKPDDTRDIHRRGAHLTVAIYIVSEDQIYGASSITTIGYCPINEKVKACRCTTTARGCLQVEKHTHSGHTCKCEYSGVLSGCEAKPKEKLFAIASCH